MNVQDYIKQHDSVGYCEAIIYPNGDIEDAIPGHTYKLMYITNEPQERINEIMPEFAGPLDWLLGYTKCVAIWYDFFKYDSITDEQLNTIQELVNNGILSNIIVGYRTDEYIRCDLLNKFYNNEIEFNEIPDRLDETIKIWRK